VFLQAVGDTTHLYHDDTPRASTVFFKTRDTLSHNEKKI